MQQFRRTIGRHLLLLATIIIFVLAHGLRGQSWLLMRQRISSSYRTDLANYLSPISRYATWFLHGWNNHQCFRCRSILINCCDVVEVRCNLCQMMVARIVNLYLVQRSEHLPVRMDIIWQISMLTVQKRQMAHVYCHTHLDDTNYYCTSVQVPTGAIQHKMRKVCKCI